MSVDPIRALLRGCRPTPSSTNRQSKVSSQENEESTDNSVDALEKLPLELDFFRTSHQPHQISSSKSKVSKSSKRERPLPSSPANSATSAICALVKSPRLHAGLKALGLDRPTAIQRRAIPVISAGDDVIAVAPTGSGKTLAYVLPILDKLVQQHAHLSKPKPKSQSKMKTSNFDLPSATFAVVIAPTKELTAQIARVIQRFIKLCRLPIHVLALLSRSTSAEARNNPNSPHIVVATPHALVAAANSKQSKVEDDSNSDEENDVNDGADNVGGSVDSDEDEDASNLDDDDEVRTKANETMDNHTEADHKRLILSHVRHVVLDEADELLCDQFVAQVDAALAACGVKSVASLEKDIGKDAENSPKVRDDKASKENVDQPQVSHVPKVHMFSATLSPSVQELATTLAQSPKRVVVGGGGYGGSAAVGGVSETIEQRFHFVGGASEKGKVLELRSLLRGGKLKPPILVFVRGRDRATSLLRELSCDGIRVDAVHADRTANARMSAISRFRTGQIWMLIATDLLARGLDFQHVNTVVNFDLPQTPPAYLHRIGRTGRNGRPGTAFTFFTDQPAERELVGQIAKIARAAGADVPDWLVSKKRFRKQDAKLSKTGKEKRRKKLVE